MTELSWFTGASLVLAFAPLSRPLLFSILSVPFKRLSCVLSGAFSLIPSCTTLFASTLFVSFAVSALIFVRAANGTDTNILGVTHYTEGWSYIPVSSVEIVLYPQHFSSPYYIKKNNQCYRITMEHELGHAFGLHHNPDKYSTMHYMYNNEQHLMNNDIDKAKQIYNILANCYQFN